MPNHVFLRASACLPIHASCKATELAAELSSLKQQLQDQQDRAAAAAAKQASAAEQQVQQLQQRLQAALAKGAAQQAEAAEAAGQLRGRLQEVEAQLATHKAERDTMQVSGAQQCLHCWLQLNATCQYLRRCKSRSICCCLQGLFVGQEVRLRFESIRW
jgi:DNA repair exonuclease SbcCD ATPase subunit